ncbi:MAG: RimK family protein [Kiritimatiellae bacterium]|nr:RimK family protein [Kiritimatiellia bacterium]
MDILLVTDDPKFGADAPLPGVQMVQAKDYLTEARFSDIEHARVFNLCRSYRYQSTGYYVSLLAAARGHKPIPSVTTIQDLKSPTMTRVAAEDLEEQIADSLANTPGDTLTLDIYFGRSSKEHHSRLAAALYTSFPAPLLRAQLRRDADGWDLKGIRALALDEIRSEDRDQAIALAIDYFSRKRFHVRKKDTPLYSMGILRDPKEANAPSDEAALDKFERAAERLGIEVDFIDRDDFASIGEYDALFIRETTRVMHHTYRFARRAEAEGLVVVDDSLSILRCANKVYLAELMEQEDIRTPRTVIVHADNVDRIIPDLGLPVVLKQPDSSFSQGVIKVDHPEDLIREVRRLLEKSDLIIAQEFIATPFDWRIGVFNRRPLYACRYYMARQHWQIIRHEGENKVEGRAETLPVEIAPRQVVRTALRVSNLIGDGLYGVDLKQVGRQVYVIEVNDNPSIEAGVEDGVLKGDLYTRIMEEFLRRLHAKRSLAHGIPRTT